MRPDRLRRRLGFALAGAGSLTLMSAAPALAQGVSTININGFVPLAIALGAGAFGLLALGIVRRIMRGGRIAERRAAGQVSSLRALVDEYEALLSGTGEVTVVWSGRIGPKFLGPAGAVLPGGRRVEAVLDFPAWLEGPDAATLQAKLTELRTGGQGFDMLFTALDGRQMRAMGWALGAGAAMRIRPTLY